MRCEGVLGGTPKSKVCILCDTKTRYMAFYGRIRCLHLCKNSVNHGLCRGFLLSIIGGITGSGYNHICENPCTARAPGFG